MASTGPAVEVDARPAEEDATLPDLSGAEFVLLGLADVNGAIKGKALRPEAFASALRDGSATTDLLLALDPVDAPITDYDGFGIRTGAADLLLHPDPATLHPMVWRPGWWVALGTPYWRDGSVCELASREVLRHTVEGMAALGYDVLSAVEYEIRVRDASGEPVSSGISYSVAEVSRLDGFLRSLRSGLEAMGIALGAVHTEAGPGLLELNLAARPAMQAADDAAFVKFTVKELAAAHGMQASFLAKTAVNEEGSSGHIHLSLWRDGVNDFAAEGGGALLSTPFRSAVAGILKHLPAASLLLNPTINSYKRLIPGWFAPVNAGWGLENRSCAVRAIVSESRPELSRLECRRPGADANPYLALAAVIASAAAGIRDGATPPPPVVGDAYTREDLQPLPSSLEEALRAFEADDVLRRDLGERFSEYYATSRRWELKAWQQTVTDWERERYDRAV